MVSRVELPVHVHKFGLSHELVACETHMIEHTGVNVDLVHFHLSLLSYSLEFTYR